MLVTGLQFTAGLASRAILNLDITLGANQTWGGSGSSWSMPASASIHLNGSSLRLLTGVSIIHMAGVIDGVGDIALDGTAIELAGANTFQGQVSVINNGAALIVQNSSALGVSDGTLANGVLVTPGSTFVVQGVNIGNEAISIGGLGQTNSGALEAQLTPSTLAGPITLTSDTRFTTFQAGVDLTLSGVISGSGAFLVTGPATTKLTNSGNSFTGGVQFNGPLPGGTLEVDADQAIPGAPALNLSNYTLRINGHAQTLTGLSGNGMLDLPTVASVLTMNNTADATFDGHITGAAGVIHHTGTGNMTLTGASTFTGTLTVDHGTVTLANATLPATVTVDNDGQLGLVSGTSGAITITKGHLQLTQGTAATSTSGNLLLGGTQAAVDINGSLPGTLPTLRVTGTVTLAGTPLNLHLPAGFSRRSARATR